MAVRNRRGKSLETRRQILAAAVSIIGNKGYTGATVDEIVQEAGVSKGTAYVHFKNKAAIAQCVLEEGIGQLTEEFESIVEDSQNAAEALVGMIEVFSARIFENRDFGRFFVSELWRDGRVWSDTMREYEERLLTDLTDQIKRGQGEGFLRSDVDPEFEAVAIVGMVLTTALYYIGIDQNDSYSSKEEEEQDLELKQKEFVDRICDFIRHANM